MRVIDPGRSPRASGATRTMTSRLVALRPGAADLIDAAFLVALVMVAMLGFTTTFDSPDYLLFALAGVVGGVVLAHLANVLRWHWLLVVLFAGLAYLGGGVVATRTGLADVALLAVDGWKGMVTVLAPVPGDSQYVVLPYLLAVVTGACGFAVARRTRRPWPAVVLPTLLVAGVIVFGTLAAPAALPVGSGFALLTFGWLAVRATRRRLVVGTGVRNVVGTLAGVGVLMVALAGGFLLGPVLPGLRADDRLVLREHVEPPVDLASYTSPLAGFRVYSSEELGRYFDRKLLTLTDVAPGTFVRLAVMDDYSGTTWTATAGGKGAASTGFQRIGAHVPDPPANPTIAGTITVEPTFAAIPELRVWVPSVGRTASIAFRGANASAATNELLYNMSTGQGLLPDALRAGDVVVTSAAPLPVLDLDGPAMTPGGQPLINPAEWGFLASGVERVVSSDGGPWEQLRVAAERLREGYWTDGTGAGEEGYRPGSDAGRLAEFLGGEAFVGSDEQYVAAMGLVANWVGFPARVVMGAVLPGDRVIRGMNVTAWVEVLTDDGQWHILAPESFIPDRSRTPKDMPPKPAQEEAQLDVPPPNPVRPPVLFDPQFTADERTLIENNPWVNALLTIGLALLRWLGPPLALLLFVVGGITGAKAWRRQRRRRRGTPAARVAGGWREITDLVRDMGYRIPADGTRREQTLAVGRPDLVGLSAGADAVIFGAGEVTTDVSADYWTDVRGARHEMLAALPFVRRWRARLSLRSLLPNKVRLSPQPRGEAARALFAVPSAAAVEVDERTVRR